MSMNRQTILETKEECLRVIRKCDEALRQIDEEVDERYERALDRFKAKADGAQDPGPLKYSWHDHSWGSKATGALRRASLDLTRKLADLRKP